MEPSKLQDPGPPGPLSTIRSPDIASIVAGPPSRQNDSTKATPPSSRAAVMSPRPMLQRNSSDESQESQGTEWFNRSNRNPTAPFDAKPMDVDPPFFPKETQSPNEYSMPGVVANVSSASRTFASPPKRPPLAPTTTQSSSADDFRSIIDDLTVENQRLKEELKRYKQFGSDLMRQDRLFEIKVHGLPSRKKRELEVTLRNFAESLESSTEASLRPQKSKSGTAAARGKSHGRSRSKHASSMTSSKSRPVDSAYASNSTGPRNHVISAGSPGELGHPSLASRPRSNNQKVENYLEHIPEGLYPRHLVITEKDKRKLVVEKLEQLFTGGIPRTSHVMRSRVALPGATEPGREAHMQVPDLDKPSRADRSTDSGGDGTSGGPGGSRSARRSGSGNGSSQTSRQSPLQASEQRPTRAHDLDPNRVQVPSETLDYIRHLGIVPPDLLAGRVASSHNVSMDADGWVYLNLLSNLAQLHMINVTPDFIRRAVSSKSTKFQLSPDGTKIRWRGGTDGTRFTSDSGNTSSRERSNDDDADDGGENGDGGGTAGEAQGRWKSLSREETKTSSGLKSRRGPFANRSPSDSVQYKPLFLRGSSSSETSDMEQSSSQRSHPDDSNIGNTSRWDYSGSSSSPRKSKRRRVDGGIIYYTGAPFCTDLSGDPGDVSPAAQMALTSNNMQQQHLHGRDEHAARQHMFTRTLSGSYLPYRPLSDRMRRELLKGTSADERDSGRSDEGMSDDLDSCFPWTASPNPYTIKQESPVVLEACGLGSIVPEDHFSVVVTTRRPRETDIKGKRNEGPRLLRPRTGSTASTIIRRHKLSRSASEKTALASSGLPVIEVEYVSARMKRLEPVPLPPAAMFFPPFSSSSSDKEDSSDSDMVDSDEQGAARSRSMYPTEIPPSTLYQASPGHAYPDDDDGRVTDDESGEVESDDLLRKVVPVAVRSKSRAQLDAGHGLSQPASVSSSSRPDSHRRVAEKTDRRSGTHSSIATAATAATAGGGESGYSSSIE